jgi:hypothetical protein
MMVIIFRMFLKYNDCKPSALTAGPSSSSYILIILVLSSQVVGEGRLAPTQRSDLLEAPSLRHEYTSVSCPIIEHAECPPALTENKPCAPLLPREERLCDPCDIKLVINGCTYNDKDSAGIPLLAADT